MRVCGQVSYEREENRAKIGQVIPSGLALQAEFYFVYLRQHGTVAWCRFQQANNMSIIHGCEGTNEGRAAKNTGEPAEEVLLFFCAAPVRRRTRDPVTYRHMQAGGHATRVRVRQRLV